jgi:hypothetical protein
MRLDVPQQRIGRNRTFVIENAGQYWCPHRRNVLAVNSAGEDTGGTSQSTIQNDRTQKQPRQPASESNRIKGNQSCHPSFLLDMFRFQEKNY